MSLDSRDHKNFHVGLKAFIAKDKKLLTLQDRKGLWELPGGRVEKREIHKDLKEILVREVTEELGKNIEYEIGPIFHAWIRKPDEDNLPDVYKNGGFVVFLVGFRCAYKSGEITLSPEHKDFKWLSKEEVGKFKFENTYKEAAEHYFANSGDML